ncbi:LuxR family transcriptional regulator [Paeniglutamicibacter antarcticus]|uniref:Cupin domain-containing protein n=1 Tax=Paeniglutamicibacter antarcticus TaxID=494023 RepID=A0ABP9TPI7_9MICC
MTAASGRSAATVHGGHDRMLRQTVIGIRAGESLKVGESPGEATLQVLTGRVILHSGGRHSSGWVGDLLIVPDAPHSLEAVENSAVLLTVAKRMPALPDLVHAVASDAGLQ